MDNLKYRTYAKIVAIVDLVITAITAFIPILLLFVAIGLTVAVLNPNTLASASANSESDEIPELTNEENKAVLLFLVILIWIIFILIVVITILEIVAAIKLLNSTQVGMDPMAAAKLARFWRTCTIVFTILVLLSAFGKRQGGSGILLVVNIIFRIVGLYIVHNYIKELDTCCTSLPMTAPHVLYNTAGGSAILAQEGHGQNQYHTYPSAPLYPNPHFGENPGYEYPAPPNYADAVKK